MNNKKFLLVILDGWGIGGKTKANAIYNAQTPHMDRLLSAYPHSQLKASGKAVGLPAGVMGNSEVGHLNIGAGRVMVEELVKINQACADNSLADNTTLKEVFSLAKKRGRKLHFIGLLSDAGVHSMNSHLYKMCELAAQEKLNNVYVHALTDGRDTDPHSGVAYIEDLEKKLNKSTGQLATVIGRYYGMDRDRRWDRTQSAYQLLTKGKGKKTDDVIKTMKAYYKKDITDEFMPAMVKVGQDKKPIALIKKDDIVVCFNFRTDRLRQLTTVFTQRDFPEFKMKTIPLHYYSMTNYDKNFKNVGVIFAQKDVKNTLGEVISKNGLKQLRLAETEKYPHVTYFFSGRRQLEFVGEKRIVVPSPPVATYDLAPAMSAPFVTKMAIREITKETPDFICLNLANADMVGHTSVYPAVIKAIEAVDMCVGRLVSVAQEKGYDIIITADHGNAEEVLNADKSKNTQHSVNPVPCILISNDYEKMKDGVLADIAPTILKIMGIDIPEEMTGKVLV